MDIKKGLTYVAFGFLFTLVNFNLKYNGTAVNIVPDFVGWILFFLAYDKLGDYLKDKAYLKWMSLGLAIFTAVEWILAIVKPDLDLDIVKTVVDIVSMVYTFILFGALEKIAHDYNSDRESTIRILKYFNIVIYALFAVAALLSALVDEKYAVLALVFGLAALVAAIITCVVLFKLKKEISEKIQ